jgi:hypothetical protein
MHWQEKSKGSRSPQVKNSCAAFKVPVESNTLHVEKVLSRKKKQNGHKKASILETATQNNKIIKVCTNDHGDTMTCLVAN